MLISSDMAINDLIELMGTKHTLGQSPRMATEEQAAELRKLLVRDFNGRDTREMANQWLHYCLSVDPEEQI